MKAWHTLPIWEGCSAGRWSSAGGGCGATRGPKPGAPWASGLSLEPKAKSRINNLQPKGHAMPRSIATTVTATAAFALAATLIYDADAQEPSRAEQLVKYRQAVYRVIGGNF